ncbi:hypothetical protein AGLY_003389 [Aphis glycines]|uniref:DDE Tnp4 domain-containing protein n=1 Tax=Aphis glycines TaxID=307491 RepID=A0A6G0U1U6_APHGL|nr:hypothetical protein AGLY_003389 [Aphis glycines]
MALAPMNQVLFTLRFYALGTMLISVADMFGVSVSSASRTIKNVSYAIAGLSGSFLKIPTNDLVETKMNMFKIARFHLVFGAIDCTHVYFSLNVQALVNADLKFMDIVARWPGSAHDCNIFRNSRLYARLESGEFNNNAILEDSGYALKSYMLTPILNPVGRIKMLYNESQIRTRNIIERCFGVWKRRFPVLSLGMRLQLKTVQAIIVATAILHNICRDMNEDLPEDNSDDVLNQLNEAEDMTETLAPVVESDKPPTEKQSENVNHCDQLRYNALQISQKTCKEISNTGDSGYPLRPWLLTPLSDPIPDTLESLFNKWLTSIRSTIERCNGILKMKFRLHIYTIHLNY